MIKIYQQNIADLNNLLKEYDLRYFECKTDKDNFHNEYICINNENMVLNECINRLTNENNMNILKIHESEEECKS